jgi:hypothetical protein
MVLLRYPTSQSWVQHPTQWSTFRSAVSSYSSPSAGYKGSLLLLSYGAWSDSRQQPTPSAASPKSSYGGKLTMSMSVDIQDRKMRYVLAKWFRLSLKYSSIHECRSCLSVLATLTANNSDSLWSGEDFIRAASQIFTCFRRAQVCCTCHGWAIDSILKWFHRTVLQHLDINWISHYNGETPRSNTLRNVVALVDGHKDV